MTSQPIKGTTKRSQHPEEDLQLKNQFRKRIRKSVVKI